MSFPNWHEERGGFFDPLDYYTIYDGWKDIGSNRNHSVVHDYCNDRIKLGKENGVLFWYCWQCEVKTDKKGKTLKEWKKFLGE